LAHFKKHTIGQTVVMGQKTLESMPKGRPLPGRNTLVLNIDAPTGLIEHLSGDFVCYSFQNLDDFHDYISLHEEELGDLVLSGGATIYRLLLDECNELILTEVDTEAENVDVWFPEYKDKFVETACDGPYFDGPLQYFIKTYKHK
ncbi:MAG: dihydrofolate reductase, partial [Firmicutes bacterium]|nr:dihydrofolate reductase [Bacillota bacterium]